MEFLESQHGPSSALDGPMVLLHEVVQVFRLPLLDFHAAVGDHAVYCRRIGTVRISPHRDR